MNAKKLVLALLLSLGLGQSAIVLAGCSSCGNCSINEPAEPREHKCKSCGSSCVAEKGESKCRHCGSSCNAENDKNGKSAKNEKQKKQNKSNSKKNKKAVDDNMLFVD